MLSSCARVTSMAGVAKLSRSITSWCLLAVAVLPCAIVASEDRESFSLMQTKAAYTNGARSELLMQVNREQEPLERSCADCTAAGGVWCADVATPAKSQTATIGLAGYCDVAGISRDGQQCFRAREECPILRFGGAPTLLQTLPSVMPGDEQMKEDWDSSPMVDERHKLVFCENPKVACTEFKRLFMRLSGQSSHEPVQHEDGPAEEFDWVHDPKTNGIRRLSDYTATEANSIMKGRDWTKAVFVRDPLERLLSGYLDKCRMPAESRHSIWHCPSQGYISFPDFVDVVFQKASTYDGIKAMDRHWRPQYVNCDMDKWAEHYQFQGNFSYLASHTKYLLQGLGLFDEYGHGWRTYGSGWSEDPHEVGGTDLFAEDTLEAHKRSTFEQVTKYYTRELADVALNFYRKDYEVFELPRPSWYMSLRP